MEVSRKDLLKAIVKSCTEQEINVSNDLVAFLISLFVLNPDYQNEEEKIDTLRIEKAIINKLRDENDSQLITLKIQHHFIKHYQNRDEKIIKHRQRLKEKTMPLIKEICEVTKIENDRYAQKLYQKIMVLITLLSGLGKPTIQAVLREVEMALQSFFQLSELPYFLAMSNLKKEEHLIELMCIVAGIRIFNKDCERGGEGIEDLPNILEKVVNRTESTILILLEEIMNKIYTYTTVIEQFLPYFDEDACHCNDEKLMESGKKEFFLKAVGKLTCYRQQEIYMRNILSDTEISKKQIKGLLTRLRERLLKLHETLHGTTAIPTSQVYPQFVDLANIWLKLQDEVIVLSQVNNFLSHMQNFCITMNVNSDSELDNMIRGVDVLTDVDRFKQSMGKLITDCEECDILYPSTENNIDKFKLEFLGFCPWTFISGKGSLIPGNPNIGIIEWRGKHFAFSSSSAAQKFGQDPNRYLSDALSFVQRRPEFIHLFQIYNEIEQTFKVKQILTTIPEMVNQDKEIQTDVHILQPYIDRKYSSSIWEHRRKALQLVNIFKSSTKSTQTIKSHFRSEVEVQAAPPESKNIQTNVNHSTSTKQTISYKKITSLK